MKVKQIVITVIIGTLMWFGIMAIVYAGERMPPDQRQQQEQEQQQRQQQDQQQHQETTVDTEQSQSMGDMVGGMQTMNFSSQRQVHSAVAPSVYATSPCFSGGSAALGLKGINFGGGASIRDTQCEMRETARMLINAGEIELGVQLLCLTDVASQLSVCTPTNVLKEDLRAALNEAQANVETLLNERKIDRKDCEESKDRIFEACKK